jgi:hypothetical protein
MPGVSPPGGTDRRRAPKGRFDMPFYAVLEFKPFYDTRKMDENAKARVFFGDYLKPRRMKSDDDLAEDLSRSDYCHCQGRGHA